MFPTTNNLRQQVINSKERDPDICLSSIVFLAVRSLDRVPLVLDWGKRKKYLHTLDYGIDVAPGINEAHGTFGKKY